MIALILYTRIAKMEEKEKSLSDNSKIGSEKKLQDFL